MSVVNEAAKRGIKLSSDFVTSSKNEDTYQTIEDILQTIEEEVPNLRIMNVPRNKKLFYI